MGLEMFLVLKCERVFPSASSLGYFGRNLRLRLLDELLSVSMYL